MNSKIDASSTANYCTKAEVQKLCLDLIANALPSLDTFNELAIALGYVAIYATTIPNQMALKASISYVDSALALKQPTITSATNLIINRLITITLEPPTGFTDLQLRANTVYVGTVFRNSLTIRSQRSVSGLLMGALLGTGLAPSAQVQVRRYTAWDIESLRARIESTANTLRMCPSVSIAAQVLMIGA